jgi:GTP-binding protein HflX
MNNLKLEQTDRAITVSLLADHYDLEELTRLCESAGVEVLGSVVQRKDRPDPKYFIGHGKVLELRDLLQTHEGTTVIFNHELSGGQVRNLEAVLDAKIIDRTQLILDIFAQRALTKEGKLQVELAQLSYLLPRLSGQGKNLSRLGGGIGTRGPGETKLETDRRHIRNRIAELKRGIAEIKRHRNLHRERRRKDGPFQVALVGYTNAGKSTLLNKLTKSEVLAENRLFATLDPTTRCTNLPSGAEIMMTDTVGFIQQLPHDLVAAFRSTLEEVLEADLIFHVVDASSPNHEKFMRVVEEVLGELGANQKERVTVYNKIDLCSDTESHLLPHGDDILHVSAFNPNDMQSILHFLDKRLVSERLSFAIPVTNGEIIALAYRIGEVVSAACVDDQMKLNVEIHRSKFEQLGSSLKKFIIQHPV